MPLPAVIPLPVEASPAGRLGREWGLRLDKRRDCQCHGDQSSA